MVVIETTRQLPDGTFEYEARAIVTTLSGFVWTRHNLPVDPATILADLRTTAQTQFAVNPDWIPPALLQLPITWQAAVQLPVVP